MLTSAAATAAINLVGVAIVFFAPHRVQSEYDYENGLAEYAQTAERELRSMSVSKASTNRESWLSGLTTLSM